MIINENAAEDKMNEFLWSNKIRSKPLWESTYSKPNK